MAVELAEAAFDPAARLAAFGCAAVEEGAVVSFTGHARASGHEGAVASLVLEAYRGVTLASMQEIDRDAHARFAVTRSDMVHRHGRIAPGEAIVFVAVAARHRRAAFEAADYMMDRLKTEAVFWKREEGAIDRWIEPTERDMDDVRRWAPIEE